MTPSSFFAAFESKEALLLILVKAMFSRQFDSAGQIEGVAEDPVLFYALETALQLCIAEQSKPLREIYVMAYSLPTTSEYIYDSMAGRLQRIFAQYMPDAKLKDFTRWTLRPRASCGPIWQGRAIRISRFKTSSHDSSRAA